VAVHLGQLIRPDLIFPDLPAADRAQVLRGLAGRIAGQGLVDDADVLFARLWEREQLGSTAIGGGIAIPHCKVDGLKSGIVALGRAVEGVDFGAADGQPVRLFFVVISPSQSPAEHLQILAAISRWIKGGDRVQALLDQADAAALYAYMQREG
jgi:mannitol/fructose-specific phosphotransferase system IIA component (Ntr-type)